MIPPTLPILFALIPPVNGIGAYFTIQAICLPNFSKGENAIAATLLTLLAAMNANQINISAMISTMIVPMIPPVVLSPVLMVLVALPGHTSPLNI